MGSSITHNKTEAIDNDIETINKSQILHTQDIMDNKEYSIVTKLTNEYNDLTNHPDPSLVKIRLRRLKKWIYMAKTITSTDKQSSFSNAKQKCYLTPLKNNVKPFIAVKRTLTSYDNDDYTTPKTKSQRKTVFDEFTKLDNEHHKEDMILTDRNVNRKEHNKIIHTDAYMSNNDKSNDSDNNNNNNHNNNIDKLVQNIHLSEYSDSVIECGLCNYYKDNKCKFIERVLKGPPHPFRILAWFILSNTTNINDIPFKDENMYYYYLNKQPTIISKDETPSPPDDDFEERIRKDIDRTFPKTVFNPFNEEHMKSLFNILKAYALLDTKVNYCQGMNIISAFILIVTNFNENDAFYLLLSLFMKRVPPCHYLNEGTTLLFSIRGLYIEGFPLLHFMNFAFERIIEKHLPQLKHHLGALGVPIDVITCKWFQTLFTIILPIDYIKRLWDCLFVYGILFMFNFAIALLSSFESELLLLKEEYQIDEFFNNLRKCALQNDSTEFYVKNAKIEMLIKNSRKIKINYNQYYDMYIKDEDNTFEETINEIENEININECVNQMERNQFDSNSNGKKIIFDTIETVEEFKHDDEYYDNSIDEGIIEINADYDNDLDEHEALTDRNVKMSSCIEKNVRSHFIRTMDIITLQDIKDYFNENKYDVSSPFKRRTLTCANLNESLSIKTKRWLSKRNTRYLDCDKFD